MPAFTFYWLAEELGVEERRFDPNKVEDVYYRLEDLKQKFDEVEQMTATINKREELLDVPKTSFHELFKIQDDLKPLFELWAVAIKVAKTVPKWIEGKFEALDPTLLEITCEEW